MWFSVPKTTKHVTVKVEWCGCTVRANNFIHIKCPCDCRRGDFDTNDRVCGGCCGSDGSPNGLKGSISNDVCGRRGKCRSRNECACRVVTEQTNSNALSNWRKYSR